jgi:hypothetical protein
MQPFLQMNRWLISRSIWLLPIRDHLVSEFEIIYAYTNHRVFVIIQIFLHCGIQVVNQNNYKVTIMQMIGIINVCSGKFLQFDSEMIMFNLINMKIIFCNSNINFYINNTNIHVWIFCDCNNCYGFSPSYSLKIPKKIHICRKPRINCLSNIFQRLSHNAYASIPGFVYKKIE